MTKQTHILTTTSRTETTFEKGKGMFLWDQNGKQYLDFIGGWAVNSLGHSPENLVKVISEQSETLINASPAFYNKPMLAYAEALSKASGFDRFFFCSTGAEANESAIKLARKYGQKNRNGAYEIITFNKAFHGRTLATMSATGKEAWKPLFEPKVPGFIQVELNDIDAVKEAITPQTCAIMLEPIQGEGGVYEATQSFIKELRALCDQEQILLIFDEVQTGFGRTGTLFSFEQYNIKPDIITLGKGIGSGYPLAAMGTTEELDIFEAGDQGGTYTAQPLGMAVGLEVLQTINTPEFLSHVNTMHTYLMEKLEHLASKGLVTNSRGKGLLIAADLPNHNAQDIAQKAFQKGLIINAPNPNTIRFIPPLIVTSGDIDEAINILETCF